jgi:hypothetical protein
MRRIMIRISKDSGRTWGNWKFRDAGELGQYAKKISIGPLGMGNQFVAHIKKADPFRCPLIGASALIEARE